MFYNERCVQAREDHDFTNTMVRSVNYYFYWILTLPFVNGQLFKTCSHWNQAGPLGLIGPKPFCVPHFLITGNTLHSGSITFHEFQQASLVQFSSVTQSCRTLCDPMDCSMPGFPVHHQVLELAQTHVHWVCDAIQPSHPLLLLPSGGDLSQHQGLF